MSIIRPFRGLRPRPEMAREVASLPYDVLSSAETRETAISNPNTFLRINKETVSDATSVIDQREPQPAWAVAVGLSIGDIQAA